MKSVIRPNGVNGPQAYSFPNPLTECANRATWKARYYPDKITQDEGFALAGMAEAYLHILTHPMGVERALQQVREVRRELRRMLAEARVSGQDEHLWDENT